MPLIPLEDPRTARIDPRSFALWALGFRPFYLLAGGFASLSIGLWALQFAGWLPHPYLSGPLWHAHEMLFGFALAVVVGFLFTAGRNWTDQPTPTGRSLAALALLWVAGRVLVLTPFGWTAALVDGAFAPAAAIALAIPFHAARNRRNYFFVGLLILLGAANLAMHLSQLSVLDLPALGSLQVALDAMLFIMAVMAGRVVPMFTNNGVPGAGAQREPRVERVALGAVLALLAVDMLPVPPLALAAVALLGAAAHALRWALWRPWKTLRTPLVWVLHAAYAWIPLHLALRACTTLGWTSPSLATHALTAGALGGLVIGMMTRTSRGHTGRPLRADGFDIACYVLVLGAAMVRVLLPWAWPASTLAAVLASAVLWSTGFGLFVFHYAPFLIRARLDGRPG
jgi:uncharacterized protein involved in response to NO